MNRNAIVSVIALTLTSFSIAADWPQFAGPDRNNVSSETGLLKAFPAEGPKVLWTIEAGPGFGGAAIRDNQVFFLDRSGEKSAEKDVLRCLNLASGEELWSYSYDAPGDYDFPGSRAVPAVTPSHVFSVGTHGHFLCIDRATQKVLWQTNAIGEGGKPGSWGIAVSPLIYKDSVIVNTQAKAGGLAAYGQATGKLLWQVQEVSSVPYCSPSLVTIGDSQQVIQFVEKGVIAVSPDTGKVLWSYTGWKCDAPIPNVTPLGDGKLFLTGGYKAGSALIQVSPSATEFEVKELWKIPHGSQIHQPLFVDGCIYLNGTTNATPKAGLMCIDPADGKLLWSTGAEMSPHRGALLLAEGLIYYIDGSGTLRLIQPNREAYTEISSAKLLAGRDIWAPMALSNGKLVVRDQKQMKCLDLRALP